jgi:uncharacterized protein
MLVYCDSMILIYYLDHVGPFQSQAASRFAKLRESGDRLAVSNLTRLECRVTPLRTGDLLTLGKFDAFFALSDVRHVPIDTPVFDRATRIRATHAFRTVDALHLAAAAQAGCDRFLTNDVRLAKFPDILVEVLS